MTLLRSSFACMLVLVVSACAATRGSAPVLPAGEAIGEPLVAQEILSFAAVDARPAAHFERTLLVEATVVAVCQKKGCWMQIEDEGATALVRWEAGCGGRYAFPKDAAGKRIVIQGSFYPKTLSPADAAHMQEEADRPLELPEEGYELNASAVLVLAQA